MERKQAFPKNGLPILYVAFELGNSTWKMASSDGRKVRQGTVTARDLEQVQGALLRTQAHFGMGEGSAVVSCYEAGRGGFWLHRYLQSRGIENVVVDSASLEVDRRLRRAKTDRIDAGKLLRMLIRYHGGEKQLWRVVRVPSREDEDARQLHRELEGLKRERTRHRNRIHGILMQQGLHLPNPSKKRFLKDLEVLRTWDGHELPGYEGPAGESPPTITAGGRPDQRPGYRKTETAETGGQGQDAPGGSAPEAAGDRPGELLGLRYGVFRVAPVSQPTGGGRLGGTHAHPLRQWQETARTRHQQGRQPTHSDPGHRDRLGLVAISTSQQVEPVVLRPVCRWGDPPAASRYRSSGPTAAHRSVAFSGVWGSP